MFVIQNFLVFCKRCGPGPFSSSNIGIGLDASITLTCNQCGIQEVQFADLNNIDPEIKQMHTMMMNVVRAKGLMRVGDKPKEEKPKKPRKPRVTSQAKLMKELIEKKDPSLLEQHKNKLSPVEYQYVRDAITTVSA